MQMFNRKSLDILPLSKRKSKSNIEDVAVNPDIMQKPCLKNFPVIEKIARSIKKAKDLNRPVILSYGAHLIKNGLAPLLKLLVEKKYITHLATNGAGIIHDWEFAFQGKTEEDVEEYLTQGQFGIWEETGKYINLAILLGAACNMGYGESVGKLIHDEELIIPPLDQLKEEALKSENGVGLFNLYEKIKSLQLKQGTLKVNHPFKKYSITHAAFENKIPLTVHPGFGYDIIYETPYNSGAAIGITAETDFLRFVNSIANLNQGVYISIGSAIMSPMIFEKSMSMARNAAKQRGEKIDDFLIVINDIHKTEWDLNSSQEPLKNDPAYYLRFCKTFSRAGAREIRYVCADNRDFLKGLCYCLFGE